MTASSINLYELFEFEKEALLLHLLEDSSDGPSSGILVLVKTRDGVHSLTSSLHKAGRLAESIHAQKKAELREKILTDFTAGQIKVLVTSASMACDLPLEGVETIIHVDFPPPSIDPSLSLNPQTLSAFASSQDKAELHKYRENAASLPLKPIRAEGFTYATKDLATKSKSGKKSGYRSKPLQNKKPKLIAKKTGQTAPRGRKPQR